MKTAMGKHVTAHLRYIFLGCLILSIVISTALFFFADGEKISAFLGGMSGGLIGVTISFLFSMYEYANIDRYRALGVLNILPNRRDTSYYADIVRKAKEIVQVMGTSCIRFIDDFADPKSDGHVLIDALRKYNNLTLTLLVPTEENMDENSKSNFKTGEEKLKLLQEEFPKRVFIKRYNFEPRHSLVRVDDHLIVGPVFQEVESKNSPAIHLTTNSEYAQKYLKYVTWVLANRCS